MKNTKRVIKIVVPALSLVCAVIFIPWVLVRLLLAPLPDTVQEEVNRATRYGLDGIIVYVDQAGKKPQLYAAGWNNREDHIPADPHTLFKIASISKLYIAAATAKLISNHQLSLNDTLAGLLPEYAGRIEYADRITLRMLLQHRSGIPDWIDDPEFPWGHPPDDVDEVLELVLGDPADFYPDKRYRYSNTNYLLLGKILDRTLGYSHRQYIREQILDPLGLKHTFGLFRDVDPAMVMSGYDSHYEGDVKMLDFVAPGGSMVATAEDVGIFIRALNSGTFFTDEELEIYSSIYKYGHTGLLPGYQSIARYHPEQDAVVVQFVNTSGGKAWSIMAIIYKRMVRILKKTRS